ncbi:MAG: hypothetical protein RJA16_1715, partial [Planctomycetota bacterium]
MATTTRSMGSPRMHADATEPDSSVNTGGTSSPLESPALVST